MSNILTAAPPAPGIISKPRNMMSVHEAASRGRRLGTWGSRTVAQSSIVQEDLRLLRNRSHAAMRDNPWIKRSGTVRVANEIGTGIVPRPATPDHELNNQLVDLWRDYTPYADYNGALSAYGIQGMAATGRHSGSEVFIIIHRVRPTVELPVPLQFQILESEFCPISLNHELLTNGNTITTGVEINPHGKVIAYWFHKKDPREKGFLLGDLQRVLAKNVIHHFIPTRPGQLRGIPGTTTGLVKAHTFESYNDSELVRKSSRADLTGTVERPDYTDEDYRFDPFTGAPMERDHQDVGIVDIEPGTFLNLLPGEIVKLFETDDAGRGYADYQRWQLLGTSAGVDIPYQLLSGDFSEINDRLWRAIFNEFKREIEYVQSQFIIPQVCRRMWIEFVDRAIMSGAVKAPDFDGKFKRYRVKHRPQAWEYIQPQQDVQSKVTAIEAGLTSRTSVVDSLPGEDSAEEVDEQRKVDKEREDKLELRPPALAEAPKPPSAQEIGGPGVKPK